MLSCRVLESCRFLRVVGESESKCLHRAFLAQRKGIVPQKSVRDLRNLWGVCGSQTLEAGSEIGGESNHEIVSFRSCARACARSGCLVEFDPKSWRLPFPFSLFGLASFPFSLPHIPQTSYPSLVLGLSVPNQRRRLITSRSYNISIIGSNH